jgi:hypothetical protein
MRERSQAATDRFHFSICFISYRHVQSFQYAAVRLLEECGALDHQLHDGNQ